MIQHESDLIITFKESETSAFEAIYQCAPPADSQSASSSTQSTTKKPYTKTQTCNGLTHNQKRVHEITSSDEFEPFLNHDQDDIWVSTVVSKNRNGRKFSPLFIHERKNRRFKEVPIWNSIIPKD